MSFGGGNTTGGGGQAQNVTVNPYAPSQPALNQIISEAGQVYNQGATGAGYVAPTTQTTTGLAQQEVNAGAANTQIQNTLAGNYLNPYLQPMLQTATSDIANSINSEFSMLTTGQQLEQIEREKNLAPFQALQQYGSIISPIASGLPVQQSQTSNNPNIFTQGVGGALLGGYLGGKTDFGTGMGALAGGTAGVLAGLL